MTTIAVTEPEGLTPRDWRDLEWLLDIFEEWLLYAEPATVRELDRLLQSVGAIAGSTAVLERVSALRQTVRRIRRS